MTKTINGATFRKMIFAGCSNLEQNKKYVDSLNVFPVPDGDTGTNMFLTLKSATNELNNCTSNNLEDLSDALEKGALRGARGNSGVILSQILKGIARVTKTCSEITTKQFAKALKEGAAIAYQAVAKPKEGTILTVIRVMAEEATIAAKKMPEFEDFMKYVIDKGEEILQKTPELLPVLAKAGVIDAGGRGLMVVFQGFYRIIINDESFEFEMVDTAKTLDNIKEFHVNLEALADIEFGYCTEFMIIHMFKKTTESDIDKLREKLLAIGDSLICTGDLSLVKVHVHTNEPNKALGYALELGELFNLKIENMREQNRELRKNATIKNQKPYGMVSVCAGDGISAVFKDLGVDYVIEGGQTMNPSADDIAKAVEAVPSNLVYVFPNNKNIILAAEQAKALTQKQVVVIPTTTVPQGISAILAFNADSNKEENISAMNESCKMVRSGSVTNAVRTTNVDGFEIKEGDIIGLDESHIRARSEDLDEALLNLVENLVNDESVNITLFYGSGIDENKANDMQQKIAEKYENCEVTAIYGGQPVYYYIVSVE